MRHDSSNMQANSQPLMRRISGSFLLILTVILLHGVLAHAYAQRPSQSPQTGRTPQKPVMPNVIGMNEKVATVILLFYGKRITKQPGPSSKPKGVVYEQSPKAGTPADQIKEIILFVSTGPAPSPSPTVAPTPTATPSGTQTPIPTRTTTPGPTRTPPANSNQANTATNTAGGTDPAGQPTPTVTAKPTATPDQSPTIQSGQDSNGNANNQANAAQDQNTPGQTEESAPSPLPSVPSNASKFPWPWIVIAVTAVVLLLAIGTAATLRTVRMRKWERLIKVTPSLDPNEVDIASVSPLDFQAPPIAVGARLEWGDSSLTAIEIGKEEK